MKQDQLSFVNQQIAGMLKAGIPLEGALRKVCEGLQKGDVRREMLALESDLAAGIPLAQALEARQFPPFYKSLVIAGQASDDLPGALVLAADHYARNHELTLRLRTVLIYPAIVLLCSFALSLTLAFLFTPFHVSGFEGGAQFSHSWHRDRFLWLATAQFAVPLLLGAMVVGLGVLACNGRVRQWFFWRTPLFQDAAMAQAGSMLAMLLSKGSPFRDAVHLVREISQGTPLYDELSHWHQQLAAGATQLSALPPPKSVFTPLFLWLAGSEGENWAGGFKQAAQIHQQRAQHRSETLMLTAIPAAALTVGVLLVLQLAPTYQAVVLSIMGLLEPVGAM